MSVEAGPALITLVVVSTQHGGQAPHLIVPVFIDGGKSLSEILLVLMMLIAIVAILRGKLQVGTCIVFRLVLYIIIIVLHTSGQRQPVGDIPLQRSRQGIAQLVVGEVVALGNPIGVLHRHSLTSVRPVLHGKVTVGVVTLEILNSIPVGTGGEQIQRNQRVEILSLRNHVVLLDARHHVAQVEGHLVVEQLGGIAHREVVTVEVVVVDNTTGIGGTQREIGLVFVRSGRERQRVSEIGRCAEEVGRVEVAWSGEFVAPAVVAARLRLSVGILELRQHEGLRELEASVIDDVGFAGSTFLGSNQDDTIGGITTIQGSSRRTRQGRDALNIVRIQHGCGITRLTVSAISQGIVVEAALRIDHGHTINHIKHVVVTVD